MQAYFDRFTLILTRDQARSASHPGPCDSDVEQLARHPRVRRQLARIPDADLIAELRETGAWTDDELQDRTTNEQRVIWLAACQIREENP
jgi:hypothetical protein